MQRQHLVVDFGKLDPEKKRQYMAFLVENQVNVQASGTNDFTAELRIKEKPKP
jgi:hypothetical protein